MTYTDDTSVFLADGEPQDISEDLWVAVLDEAGSFTSDPLWAPFDVDERPDAARILYKLVTAARQRASYWLAKPFEEHGAGTNQNSVLWRHKTRSWGNATSVRLTTLTDWEAVYDEFRGRWYIRYANVVDSLKDAIFRIIDPTFVYVQGGHRTVLSVGRMFVGWDGPAWRQYVDGLLHRMNEYVAREQAMAKAQIPGFTWHAADTDHFDVGRTQKIRGGAQHYSAGTNSLPWLTTTSKPPVSATFLVKHEPTMEDRGWQLVKIEDTAWTTAFANPYTVSVEYEHKAGQPIPDIAYAVLAQTWADIAHYVQDHGLGAITSILGHKEWVGNTSLICPDGIDITRIQREWVALMTPPVPPDAIHLNGFQITQGFKGFWEELENYEPTLPYRVLGLPLENEWSPEPGRAYQRFERGTLKWAKEEPVPYHIHLKPLSETEPEHG